MVNGWLWLWKCWPLNPINVTLANLYWLYIYIYIYINLFHLSELPKKPMYVTYILGFWVVSLSSQPFYATWFLYFSLCLCHTTFRFCLPPFSSLFFSNIDSYIPFDYLTIWVPNKKNSLRWSFDSIITP